MKARDSIYAKRIYSLSQAFALRVYPAALWVPLLKWSNTKRRANEPTTPHNHWPKFSSPEWKRERVAPKFVANCCREEC